MPSKPSQYLTQQTTPLLQKINRNQLLTYQYRNSSTLAINPEQILDQINQLNAQQRSLISDYNHKEVLIIRDSDRLKEKLRHFHKHGGLDNLCILTDFDYTLTRYSHDGQNKLDSSFACIRNSQFATEEFKQFSNHLYKTYHPYEKALDLTQDKKIQKLQEWWSQDLQQIKNLNLHTHQFYHMIEESNLYFRHGMDHLLHTCSRLQVPLVIVSAAISDVVEKAVDKLVMQMNTKQMKLLNDHIIDKNVVHVIANKSKKCPQSHKILDFEDPMVHTCNKDDVVHQYFKQQTAASERALLQRRNVIVMGDLIDDIKMARHLHQNDEDLLSIGFFNNPEKDGEDLLMEYQKHFDMVVVNDGNLHFLHYFLSRIAQNSLPDYQKHQQNVHDHIMYEDLKECTERGAHLVRKQHKINELFD